MDNQLIDFNCEHYLDSEGTIPSNFLKIKMSKSRQPDLLGALSHSNITQQI